MYNFERKGAFIMTDIFELFARIEKGKRTDAGNVGFIIAGLGNPGAKYTFTRHNAGFLAVDYMSQKLGFDVKRSRFRSLSGEAVIDGVRALILKPQTYMNLSGEAVGEAAAFYKLPPERVLVICDDISLPVGTVRIRAKGSAGGHNGLKSIIEHLGSEDFPRIKLGVGGKPSPEWDLADWVTGAFDDADKEKMFAAFGRAADAVPLIVGGDIAAAQGKYNG